MKDSALLSLPTAELETAALNMMHLVASRDETTDLKQRAAEFEVLGDIHKELSERARKNGSEYAAIRLMLKATRFHLHMLKLRSEMVGDKTTSDRIDQTLRGLPS